MAGRLGWAVVRSNVGSPDGAAPLREAYGDTILLERLAASIARLNPLIPEEARQDAVRSIIAADFQSCVEENRRLHKLIVEGVPVEYHAEDGTIRGDRVRIVDFDDTWLNDWLATNQFSVIENGHNRRPDVVLFVNGLPLAVVELKNPGDENATLTGAYNQLQTYKNEIPSLFRTNAMLVASDGVQARLGSLTATEERFMPWRTTDGREIASKGSPELGVLIEGVFEKRQFLELLRDFTVFGDTGAGIVKIIAGYHQYHAAKRAVTATLRAMPRSPAALGARSGLHENPLDYRLPSAEEHPPGDKRIGIIWHTQGSGKSLVMAFYAGQLIQRPELENPTIIVITDRNDLDDQLFGTFAMCRDLIRQTPVQADSREDLQSKLDRASGGVIFTTIQKFSPLPGETEYPALSERRNVVVIADEAHRSQYGFRAKMDRKSGALAYRIREISSRRAA